MSLLFFDKRRHVLFFSVGTVMVRREVEVEIHIATMTFLPPRFSLPFWHPQMPFSGEQRWPSSLCCSQLHS